MFAFKVGTSLARLLTGIVILVAASPSAFGAEVKSFSVDSYSIEYPAHWTYKQQPSPDGNNLHMFMGPQLKGAMAYCHTVQQPINQSLTPRLSRLTEAQRIEFFTNSDDSYLFAIYFNLASAQGFKLIHSGAVTIGKTMPGYAADFFYRVPQGFVYRVRSYFTFWKGAQLSVWCQAVSKSEAESEDAFLVNLETFQRFVASVKVRQ